MPSLTAFVWSHLILHTTRRVPFVLIVVVRVHAREVVVHAPAVRVRGTILRSRPPKAVVANVVEDRPVVEATRQGGKAENGNWWLTGTLFAAYCANSTTSRCVQRSSRVTTSCRAHSRRSAILPCRSTANFVPGMEFAPRRAELAVSCCLQNRRAEVNTSGRIHRIPGSAVMRLSLQKIATRPEGREKRFAQYTPLLR